MLCGGNFFSTKISCFLVDGLYFLDFNLTLDFCQKAGFLTYKKCYEVGVNFKATGDCLIIAPPFISEKKHIDEIINKLTQGITAYSKLK